VNQRPREIGVVLSVTDLDAWLQIDETELLADTHCLTVRPLRFRNDRLW
jgi:hypothetical protein